MRLISISVLVVFALFLSIAYARSDLSDFAGDWVSTKNNEDIKTIIYTAKSDLLQIPVAFFEDKDGKI
ncbi:MAG: hypothetical protein HYS98_07500 [Deltaproteobacteria bacterium]|nr:hypothetical protein [Deltaproteobacteria bacterium]